MVASDKVVKPIMGNPEIEVLDGYDYVEKVEDFVLLKNSELQNLEPK